MPDRHWAAGAGDAVRLLGLTTVTTAFAAWCTLAVVARLGGEQIYAPFAVLWGAYYGVAGLQSGLQHEVTRSAAAAARHPLEPNTSMWRVGLAVAGPVALLATATALGWGDQIGGLGAAGALLLGVGFLGVGGLLCVNGVLAAQGRWRLACALLLGDAALRLVAVAIVLAFEGSLGWQAAAVSVGSLIWLPLAVIRRGAVMRAAVAALPTFAPRAAAAVVAAGCNALVVAGLPLLLAVTSETPLSASSAGLLAALVLFRSPLLVLANGLRPAAITHIVETGSIRRPVLHAWAACVLVGAATAGVAALAGRSVLRFLFGPGFVVTGGQAAGFVASALMLCMLTVSAVAFIAVDHHLASTGGWALTLAVTILLLLTPLELGERLLLATMLGPLPALGWHGWLLWRQPAGVQTRTTADGRIDGG